MFDDGYIQEVSRNYWAEEDEMKLGIHPSQVSAKVVKALKDKGIKVNETPYLDWHYGSGFVGVRLDSGFVGVFDYRKCSFVDKGTSNV